jgi:hypothetical protein
VRTAVLGQVADDGIDVVDERAVRFAKAVVDGRTIGVALRVGDDLRGVANVLAVEFAHHAGAVLLLLANGSAQIRIGVDEIVEAGKLPQAILAAEFVETRHAVFAVANQIERRDVDLFGRAVQARHGEVLNEHRVIAQRQKAQLLAADGERPVAKTALPHLSRLGAKRVQHRHFFDDPVRVALQVAIFEKIGD